LTLLGFDPPPPAVLSWGERLFVRYSYTLASHDSCYTFVDPLTDGKPSPGCGDGGIRGLLGLRTPGCLSTFLCCLMNSTVLWHSQETTQFCDSSAGSSGDHAALAPVLEKLAKAKPRRAGVPRLSKERSPQASGTAPSRNLGFRKIPP
jgi:hypothetical protein